ncbi:mobile mystery protein A [Brevundimonas sp.]|uniref:mobile mystery protein A n=1 Tax=Brevundimonas sp. TaxID=1871086 RepID=UPI002737E4B2|nr:mobile mystery protein A [Brevundimonas sp.]MDP3801573.1 mobile mystery protein A [Brevundimonas sp.]
MMSLVSARRSLDDRLASLKGDVAARPHRGWVRAVREALGMTGTQLAERLKVDPSTISALEKGEVQDTVTLATLRRAAGAMNCRLVYALVPETSLEQTVRDRAATVVDVRLGRLGHTMALENQALSDPELADERGRMIEALIREEPRRLWQAP